MAPNNKRTQRPGSKKQRSTGSIILYTFLIIACIGGGGLIGIALGMVRSTPKLENLAYKPSITTIVYDAKGHTIAKFHAGENRTPVPISKIPQKLQDAIVAIEDNKFYSHHGINPTGIIRAFIVNLREGRIAQGGSTITQQLVKSAFLTPEKVYTRKIKEAILAVQLERNYTKEEILELYLNQIYFGHGAYGVEAAAQIYFGKSVADLSLSESALIAGVTKGPRYYSPYIDPEAAIRRRNVVLQRMYEVGFIGEGDMQSALDDPLRVVGLVPSTSAAPYFIEYIRDELIDKFGVDDVYKGGLRVYTTLDLGLQRAAESALIKNLPNGYTDAKGLKQPQGALICVDPQTGYIKAMVGGRGDDKYNRATQAVRQPGSAFKPFVYVAAFDNGYSPNTRIVDEPVSYPSGTGRMWSPSNYDGKYRGAVTLRKAVESSINSVAVKVADQLGVSKVIDIAQRLGITTLVRSGSRNDNNLSLALGGLTRGVTPLELLLAYSTFTNTGFKVKPISILRVEDRFGNLRDRSRISRTSVLSETTAFLITDVMRGVIERGTGQRANIGRPAAGKTGTTSDNTNAWFVGFTPELATAVWIGNDEQSKPIRENGVSIGSARAATIWGIFMKDATKGTPVRNFTVPEDVQPDLTTIPPSTPSSSDDDLEENPNGVAPPLTTDDVVEPSTTDDIDAGIDDAGPGSSSGTGFDMDSDSDSDASEGSGNDAASASPTGNAVTASGQVRPAAKVQEVLICVESEQLATDACPPESVITRLYDSSSGKEVDNDGILIDGTQRPVEACPLHPGPLRSN